MALEQLKTCDYISPRKHHLSDTQKVFQIVQTFSKHWDMLKESWKKMIADLNCKKGILSTRLFKG